MKPSSLEPTDCDVYENIPCLIETVNSNFCYYNDHHWSQDSSLYHLKTFYNLQTGPLPELGHHHGSRRFKEPFFFCKSGRNDVTCVLLWGNLINGSNDDILSSI